MLNLLQLKSLAAILAYQSFSAAANKVGLSHSAISLDIKSLEIELGQPIFDRSTRPATFLTSGQKAAEPDRFFFTREHLMDQNSSLCQTQNTARSG